MLISPVHLKTLAHTLDVEGHDAAPVLAVCGARRIDDIDEDGDWVPLSLFAQMLDEAVAATGDPHFGLVAGKSLALMRYGAIIPVVLANRHLRQVMADIERFARLTTAHSEMTLHTAGDSACLRVDALVQAGPGGRLRTEQIVTSAVQMLRFCGASAADVFGVELTLDEPPAAVRPRYTAAMGQKIAFNQAACRVHFHPRLLEQPLPMHDPVAYTAAVARAEALLAALAAGSDLAEQVREVLLAALPQTLSVGDTAARLGLNDRQLRRRLGGLGTSHADLLQQCQRLQAERLLADGRMPIKQVADALGFGSVHAFHRAFKRWTGATPTAWKQG